MVSAYLFGLTPVFRGDARAEGAYPSVDDLPALEEIPDPFQVIGSDRRVRDKED